VISKQCMNGEESLKLNNAMACKAISEISSGGYDVQVIGEYSPQLNCGICTLIICDATHGCIDHAFCKVCILKHIECGIRTNGNFMCPGGCAKAIDPTKYDIKMFK